MSEYAKLIVSGKEVSLPVFAGTENEGAIDISRLRQDTGYVTFDPGYANSSPATSAVTFLDGDNGILRYRGYPIEELCARSSFDAVSYLVVYGELPSVRQLASFRERIARYRRLPEPMLKIMEGLPVSAHPMVTLSMLTGALSAYYPQFTDPFDPAQVEEATIIAIGSMPALTAFAYRHMIGKPFEYPEEEDLSTAALFLKLLFGQGYHVDEDVEKVFDELLILHADHEFNCSTSTVRMIGSSHANLFASVSGGVNALWGPLHGGANQAVLEMLEEIHAKGFDPEDYIRRVKRKEDGVRLMGFGHRVYKNYDPRARIIKGAVDRVMAKIGADDPFLKIARVLEQSALSDEYFTSRKLYPNVDFYSGIVYRALGIPVDMFTPIFALGRLPGWIAHWREQNADTKAKIGRPRQIYTGAVTRNMG